METYWHGSLALVNGSKQAVVQSGADPISKITKNSDLEHGQGLSVEVEQAVALNDGESVMLYRNWPYPSGTHQCVIKPSAAAVQSAALAMNQAVDTTQSIINDTSVAANANSISKRDAAGRLAISPAIADNQAVTLAQLNAATGQTTTAPDTSLSRFNTYLKSAQNAHYLFNQIITLDADFKIEWEAELRQPGYFFADTTSTEDTGRFMINGDGEFLHIFGFGFPVTNIDNFVSYSSARRALCLQRIGSNINFKVDGQAVASTQSTDTFTLNSAGTKFAGATGVPSFEGVKTNLVLTKAGNALIDAPLDGNYSDESPQVSNNAASGITITAVNINEGDSVFYDPTANPNLNIVETGSDAFSTTGTAPEHSIDLSHLNFVASSNDRQTLSDITTAEFDLMFQAIIAANQGNSLPSGYQTDRAVPTNVEMLSREVVINPSYTWEIILNSAGLARYNAEFNA